MKRDEEVSRSEYSDDAGLGGSSFLGGRGRMGGSGMVVGGMTSVSRRTPDPQPISSIWRNRT
jgi:hypothetical protein